MRVMSGNPGGKFPLQLPPLFQSNVPPVVIVQLESANVAGTYVTTKKMDARSVENLTRIIPNLPLTAHLIAQKDLAGQHRLVSIFSLPIYFFYGEYKG